MTEKKQLTAEENKVLKKMFWQSHKVFHNFNMTKMEANGFTMTMSPAIESIYKDDENEKKKAYLRHQAFFNTHAVAFNFIAGLSYALEQDYHEGKIDENTINAIKVSLMGPTAGMFDSLFFNCLRVIAAGISIGICASGNFLGSILFILIYGVSQSICKYYLTRLGYTLGTGFIDSLYNSGLMTIATKCVSIVGIMMVGAMTATTVSVPLNFTIHVGGTEVIVQDLFNAIYPDILSVVMVLVIMSLIKKGKRPTMIIFSILVIGIIEQRYIFFKVSTGKCNLAGILKERYEKIILFADDFGFSEGMNLGVIKACRKGAITDINLIVNMMTSKEAVYLHDQYCPELPMSAHINFVQGKPISNPKEIPTLVDENGYFYRSYLWKSDDLEHSKAKGIIYPSKEDLYKETKAQILRFKELTGKMPCHFDAHSMMTEEMKKAFMQVGKEFGIHEPLDNNAKKLYEVPMHTPSGRSILTDGTEVNDFLEDHLNLLKSEHEVNILHFHPGFIDEFIIENTSLILPRAKDLDTLCQPEIKKWIKEHFLITNIEKELPVGKC